MKILKVRNQTNALIKEEIAHLLLLRFKHLNKKWLTAQHAGSIPANIWCQTCNRFNSAHLLNTLRVVRPSGPWHYLQARLFSDDRLHLLFKLLLCPGHEPGTHSKVHHGFKQALDGWWASAGSPEHPGVRTRDSCPPTTTGHYATNNPVIQSRRDVRDGKGSSRFKKQTVWCFAFHI